MANLYHKYIILLLLLHKSYKKVKKKYNRNKLLFNLAYLIYNCCIKIWLDIIVKLILMQTFFLYF